MTTEYDSLHPAIQRWVHHQGWSDLRPIQKKAIPYILSEKTDVLISANTAAGKTEAFFLPALTKCVDDKHLSILHISPLKALINDQHRRLSPLCEKLDIQLTSWHGDSNASKKQKTIKRPRGVIMITPESLEALLVNKPSWVLSAFKHLRYFAIDEYHAFIGTERGHQLTSLLNRIEFLLERTEKPIPRVALSATLGELSEVPSMLRPLGNFPCKTLTETNKSAKLQLTLQGFYAPIKTTTKADDVTDREFTNAIFTHCQGGSHLVFANNRQRTENLSASLSDLCSRIGISNEFFPHHGSLDKKLRQDLEARLQKESLPTTAICTNTLELGVDIGKTNSVIQVTPPVSSSSLRQRLGRSGRRGGPSVLKVLITEHTIEKDTHIVDRLRLGLLQTIAIIHLLLVDKWFESANKENYHFSTLIQQTLSLIAQYGSARADKLYYLLCQTGPFNRVTSEMFICLLKKMGDLQLITQTSDRELAIGLIGEKITNDYTFYSAFNTPQEFSIRHNNRSIGNLPVESALSPGQHIVFAGQFWCVDNVDYATTSINVSSSSKGAPPRFGGSSAEVSTKVRQKMFELISKEQHGIKVGEQVLSFLDKSAENLFLESTKEFKDCKLKKSPFAYIKGATYIFPWSSDRITMAIAAILLLEEYSVGIYCGVIEVKGVNSDMIKETLLLFLDDPLDDAEIAETLGAKPSDKYDELLPNELLNISSGLKFYDVKGAITWINKHILKTPKSKAN